MVKIDYNRANVILHRLGMQGDILNQHLQNLKESVFQSKDHLATTNPFWDIQKDTRLFLLGKFVNIIERTQFNLHILGKLLDEDWCQANLDHPTQQEADYKLILTVETERSMKYDFGMYLFTLIENSFRIFLRSIDPVACNGATAAFESIYNSLLGVHQLNFPDIDRQNIVSTLNFIRTTRNLIHNDGVYFDKNGQNASVTYRGASYNFINGKPVDFITWKLLLLMAEDIYQILIKVITHPRIIALPQVTDPFGSHMW